MATISEILAARTAAGARYAAAVTELRAAYVDLAGIDAALGNNTLAGLPAGPVQTFRGDADRIPVEFRHPVYSAEAGGSLIDARAVKRDQIIASVS